VSLERTAHGRGGEYLLLSTPSDCVASFRDQNSSKVCVVSYFKLVLGSIDLLGTPEGFCFCSRPSGLTVHRPAASAVKQLISLPAIRHSGVLNTMKSLCVALLWIFVMSDEEHAQRKHL
jgi:hypothetical protein